MNWNWKVLIKNADFKGKALSNEFRAICFRLIFFCTVFVVCTNAYSQTNEEEALKRAESLFESGISYFQEGDYNAAKKNLLDAKNIFKKVLGDEDLSYAGSLIVLGSFNYELSDYTQAEKYFLEAKIIEEKILGKDHPDYVALLSKLGFVYFYLKDFAQSEKYLLEAEKAIRMLENKHPDSVNDLFESTIFILGALYYELNNFELSEKYYLEVKKNIEKVEGEDSSDYYQVLLRNLGTLYFKFGNYENAKKYFIDAKNNAEKVFGKEHLEYAHSLHSLSILYLKLDDFIHAETYLLEAKNIWDKENVQDPLDYALLLVDLGKLYSKMSDYAQAENYLLEAKNICLKENGNEHINYVLLLGNLGVLYSKVGDYVQAENYFIEEKKIAEKVIGTEHDFYAAALSNLGVFYYELGDYLQAENYYIESKKIYEKVIGKEHVDYANTLNNLGALYYELGDYVQAENYYVEAKNLQEKVFGKEHAAYTTSLNNLGMLYLKLGDYEQAEKYLLETKEIEEKLYKKEHSEYATTLNNLFNLYYIWGDFVLSEKYAFEAMIINEKVIGKEHPNFVISLHNMFYVLKYMKEYEKAALYNNEACKLFTGLISKNFAFLSERQRDLYWNKYRHHFFSSYSLSYFHSVPEVNSLNYNNALFVKGLLLRTTNDIRNAIFNSGNQNLIELYNKLRGIRQQIEKLQTKTEEGNLDKIKLLEKEADELDKALTVSSVAYRDLKADLNLKWKDIRDNLAENEVAIEFIDFQIFDKYRTDTTIYAALLLRKDSEAPVYIPLFEKSQLDSIISDDNPTLERRIDKLYNGGNTRFFNGHKLYQLIWEPLEQYLSGIETIYYSPSGVLNQIAFSAIPVDTVCLKDKYDLHLVSSTREVVNAKKESQTLRQGSQSVLYGGIQYDVFNPKDLQAAVSRYRGMTITASHALSEDLSRSGMGPLPGTEIEVIEIEKIIKKSNITNITYIGVEANEESFKALSGKSPTLLHVATHGFFLQDEKDIKRTGFMELMGDMQRVVRNPLLRSGLLFAGANRAWTNKDVIPDIEDGILLAEEISKLDLSNTTLVVLSACETALGQVKNSEGVFGLQRAFKLAGVETLVMSLWGVEDQATKDFMITFYQNLMDGKSKLQSFKTAQDSVREKYRNPYYWAGFVMMD